MLLRSSSTPILGSVLASSSCPSSYFSESPSHGTGGRNPFERTFSDNLHKLSFHHGGAAHGHHLNAASHQSFSCQFSPSPAAAPEVVPGAGGFRRVRSDGNLQDLAAVEYQEERRRRPIHHLSLPMRSGSRRPSFVVESIPSFSLYTSRERGESADLVVEEEEEEQEDEEEEEEGCDKDGIERSVTIGENISAEFLFPGEKGYKVENAGEQTDSAPLFLAKGLGLGIGDTSSGLIVGIGGGAGGVCDGHPLKLGNDGNKSEVEAYYKKMVEEDPNSALFLRNYALFLYQSKGDPVRAEEYYSRAILAEPGDGEVLSQYAKLIWDLHRDRERASTYFEQAVQAAPQDSHVLAAYASFLWETEDDEEDDGVGEAGRSQDYSGARVSYGALASAHV